MKDPEKSTHEIEIETLILAIDTIWLILTGCGIVLTQVGFALLEAAHTRRKDEKAVLFKNLLDHSIASVCWFYIGYKVYRGTSILDSNEDNFPRIFQQFGFEITTSSIVSACVIGRMKLEAYLTFSALLASFTYPALSYFCWTYGPLASAGFKDFGGGGIVHLFGGVNGLIGLLFCGKRYNQNNTASSSASSSHSHASPHLTAIGGLVLYVAWFFVNAGSSGGIANEIAIKSAGRAVLNTSLAAGAASLQGYFLCKFWKKRFDLSFLVNSLISGLISITAPCGFIDASIAVLIGLTGPILMMQTSKFISSIGLDDPLDALSVHGICGLFGCLMVGLFHTTEGLFYTLSPSLLVIQALGCLTIILWGIMTATPLFYIFSRFDALAYSESQQNIGLDALYFAADVVKEQDKQLTL